MTLLKLHSPIPGSPNPCFPTDRTLEEKALISKDLGSSRDNDVQSVSEEVAEQVTYDLKASTKAVGYLYPTIVDKHDRIIDGQHRLRIDPDWPCFRLSHIDTLPEYLMARIIANMHRRTPSAEEKTEWLSELAAETGWTPKQLAEKLGVSYTWVMKYLPPEAKERPGVGGPRKPSERVTRRVTQPEPQPGFHLEKDADGTDRFLDGLENLSFCLRAGDKLTTALVSWCRTKKVHWSAVVLKGLRLFFVVQGEEL